MSYDLMVFDPDAAPRDRRDFMDWYDLQTEWSEDHDYKNPDVSAPPLKSWFLDINEVYPAIDGPYGTDIGLASYSAGRSLIYACFAWEEAENAYRTVFSLAEKHKVGFFDVSATNGEVWMPDASGSFVKLHGG